MAKRGILHIAIDEKFINSANLLFEQAFAEQNTFFILVRSTGKPLKHVELKPNVIVKKKSQTTFNEILGVLENYSLVVLHCLDFFKSRLVLKSGSSVKFLWLFWGWEMYNNKLAFPEQFLGLESQKLVKHDGLLKRLKKAFQPLYCRFKYGTASREAAIVQAAAKVQYIGLPIEEDYELLKARGLISCEHVKFSYCPLEFVFAGNENCVVNGDNVLLGNSAALTNNHTEAFQLLSQLNLGERKIVTPLSYGNSKGVDNIILAGEKLLGNNFSPITDFMPLAEYNSLLRQCGIVVMNHYRQQAIGNIMAMVWMGSKIYLDERNPIYGYLKRLGVSVFSIERDLVPENQQVFTRLSDAELRSNQKKILLETGQDYLIESLRARFLQIL